MENYPHPHIEINIKPSIMYILPFDKDLKSTNE